MKLIGQFKDIVKDSKGNVVVSFTIENYTQQQILQQIKDDKYSIEVKKYKDSRTLQQNKYLWLLISEIDKSINGVASPESEMSIYISALLKAGAKYTNVAGIGEIEETLKQSFRAVQYVKPFNEEKGTNIYRVFYGSSKFDKNEFALLVDVVKQMGYENGVEMSYWEEVLSVWKESK